VTSRTARFGILSSGPPTPCGIATFSTALGLALERQGGDVRLVRVVDRREALAEEGLKVVAHLVASEPPSIERAIDALNDCDIVLVQHEYGLYGGRDGQDILRVLQGVRSPIIAILHTVLRLPTHDQVTVLNAVIDHADQVVVMTEKAATTLRMVNELGHTPVAVIPHGAAVMSVASRRKPRVRPVLLTWGLIGPGKGIQWVIDALVHLRDIDPKPRYIIAGRTHPKVLAYEGDIYRESLEHRVAVNGVHDMVEFDNSYRDLESLNGLIETADVVVLPYDSLDQATSGVLVDAVAAGRPVIATDFPHAQELLSSGAGLIVGHGDATALARAIRRVLTETPLASSMSKEARRIAPSLSWDAVADQYHMLSNDLLGQVAVGA